MTRLTYRFFLVVAFCFAQQTLGQNLIQPFSDQRVMYASSKGQGIYPLTLGTFEKINGESTAVKEAYVEGRLESATLEIIRPYKLDSAWMHIQNYFKSKSSQLIFDCEGFSCGSSNTWANKRFEVKQLYGLDASQHYQVWRVKFENVSVFVSVYLVQRGNRRVYLQLESLYAEDPELMFVPSAQVLAKEFYRERKIEVFGLSFQQGSIDVDPSYIKSYAKAFNQRSYRKLVVSGFDALPGEDDEKQARARKYAQAVAKALETEGVHRRRMTINTLEKAVQDESSSAVFVFLD